jgi:putative membrane protein
LREPAGEPKSGFSWFIEKFSVLAAIAVLQSLLLDAVMLWGLDLQVQSVPNFILFTVITSITFVSLVQFLVTPLENAGRFLAVLLLICQLTSSAGTFPLEVIPEALQRLNPWLPMTYSVFGFKAAISSGDFSFMWQNAGILGLFTAAFAGGTILFFHREHKRKYGHMRSDAMEAPRA